MSAYYSFLPHLRLGLAGLTTTEDTGSAVVTGERATIGLSVPVKRTPKGGGADQTASVPKTVFLKGPGDVLGINSKAIVKVSPQDWVTNFEPNYLPYIEFYDEDFPWRYTPAKARQAASGQYDFRLRPWVSLVVLKETEFTSDPFNGILPSITIASGAGAVFPKAEQMWAWAHVHVNGQLGNDNTAGAATANAVNQLKGLLATDPDKALSRVICPRKLEPNTGYHAFLIPTFESGRRAGLGNTTPVTNALEPSWTGNTPAAGTSYPVYHRWFFKTGAAGDFESLVRLLQPRAIGTDVGKRAVDLQIPGHPELDLETSDPVIGLEGALEPPTQVSDPWPLTTSDDFTENLTDLLNKPQEYLASGGVDPIIAPPIYGRWHALRETVSSNINSSWLEEANLDPRFRIFAGAGAEVVRTNQEEYMNIAWKQIGEVMEANKKIRKMQLAAQASEALHGRHLGTMADENVIAVSASVHPKVKVPTDTVFKVIKDSAVPNSMFSGAFRRMTRDEGPLMRTLNETSPTPVDYARLVYDVSQGNIQIALPAQAPLGQISLTAIPANNLNASYTNSLPQVSNYNFLVPGVAPSPPVYGINNTPAQQYQNAAILIGNYISSQPIYNYTSNPSLDTVDAADQIRIRTAPKSTVFELAQKQIVLTTPQGIPQQITILNIILEAPKIMLPVYKEMVKLSTEWLMPGLNSIAPNSINLLRTNQKYIEAFMLGMNHEMSRELLWREYPTDQRGTPFQFFWGFENAYTPTTGAPNLENFRDIKPIHEWRVGSTTTLTQLGANTGRPATTNPDLLVLTIRGELLRKYPGTIVYLQKAKWKENPSGSGNYTSAEAREVVPGTELYPIFSATLEPDIYFLGFDMDAVTARGSITSPLSNTTAGYYFVFQERAGEVRFGADEINPNTSYTNTQIAGNWSGLSWGHLAAHTPSGQFVDVGGSTALTISLPPNIPNQPIFRNPTWGRNSADMAHILLQDPVKLYVHTKELIPA